MARPLTYDFLAGKKKPLKKTVVVVLDPDLAETYEEARRERDVAHARVQVASNNPEAHAALLDADQALAVLREQLEEEDAIATFTFRGIGRAAYEGMVDRHRPTPEQRTQAKANGMGELAWNPETLPPALVAACLIESALTEAEVAQLWSSPDWNQAELGVLLNAAIEVNGSRRTVDLGKDFRQTRSSDQKSRTA
jgi:hypothetical protein